MSITDLAQVLGPVLDLEPGQIFVSLLLALILSIVVALTYRFSVPGRVLSPAMQSSLVLLAMVAAMVMMVIGNNIARAFSLVGALAIVRFRTRLRSPWDITFIFFGLAVGIACGVFAYRVAVIGTIMISLSVVALSILPLAGLRSERIRMLRCDLASYKGADDEMNRVLDEHLKRRWLVEARSLRFGETLSYRFRVEVRREEQIPSLIRDLSDIEGVERVILDFEDEGPTRSE